MVLHSAVSVHLISVKALYTSIPGRHVHFDTNSTSLGSIQPCCNYCANTIHSHSHCCLQPGTQLYSKVNLGVAERTNARASKQDERGFEPRLSRIGSVEFYRWAIGYECVGPQATDLFRLGGTLVGSVIAEGRSDWLVHRSPPATVPTYSPTRPAGSGASDDRSPGTRSRACVKSRSHAKS